MTTPPWRYPVKLVRDRLVESFEDPIPEGVHYDSVGPQSRTHVDFLRQKLLEEVGEYLADPSTDELADVYEVLLALDVIHGGNMKPRARWKRERRGGFHDALVMYVGIAPVESGS